MIRTSKEEDIEGMLDTGDVFLTHFREDERYESDSGNGKINTQAARAGGL